jgi:hypothetical protein
MYKSLHCKDLTDNVVEENGVHCGNQVGHIDTILRYFMLKQAVRIVTIGI